MKPFILPDYFDGSKVSTSVSLNYFIWMTHEISSVSYINKYNQLVYSIDHILNDDDRVFIEKELDDKIKAEAFCIFVTCYLKYTVDSINYVVSKPLVECLTDTNINLKRKYFPENFSAYFEIPNLKNDAGQNTLGLFCNIFPNKNNELMFHVNSIDKHGEEIYISHSGIILNSNKSIEEQLQDIEGSKLSTGGLLPKETAILLLNLIIYINSKNADIVLEKNEFSKKKTKLEAQLKQFTQKNWVMLGKNFHTKNLPRGPLTCDAFEVRGHYRWQVCGKGRLERELIFIDPFMKGLQK